MCQINTKRRISCLEKFLLSMECKIKHSETTDSVYCLSDNLNIRISDHLSSDFNGLSIVFSQFDSNIIVTYDKRFESFSTIKETKYFIKSLITIFHFWEIQKIRLCSSVSKLMINDVSNDKGYVPDDMKFPFDASNLTNNQRSELINLWSRLINSYNAYTKQNKMLKK